MAETAGTAPENFQLLPSYNKEILCFQTYEDWRVYLKNFEIETGNHYIISAESKGFSKEVSLQDIIQENQAPKLRWEFKAANCLWPIPFTGSPYIHLGMQEYHCHQGKDSNLKQKLEKRMNRESDIFKKPRKMLHPTKKVGCPVKFIVKKVFRFLDYNLKDDSRRNRKKMLDDIRLNEFCLNSHETISPSELFITGNIVQYLVVMPIRQHRHMKDNNGYHLDKRVKEFIINQIQEGNTRPKDIELKVEDFVRDTLFQGAHVPEQYRDLFFPSRKKISNIKIAYNKYSQMFQENLDHLVDWTRFTNEELLGSDDIHDVDNEVVATINGVENVNVEETCMNDNTEISNDNRTNNDDEKTILGDKRTNISTNQVAFGNNRTIDDNSSRGYFENDIIYGNNHQEEIVAKDLVGSCYDKVIVNNVSTVNDDNRAFVNQKTFEDSERINVDSNETINHHGKNIDDNNDLVVHNGFTDDDNETIIDVCDNSETTAIETAIPKNIICDPIVALNDNHINNAQMNDVQFSVDIPAINYACSYYTHNRFNFTTEQQLMFEKNLIEEKKMSIRTTLQQFMEVTEILNDHKTLDDLDITLMTCLDGLRVSLSG